MKLVLLFQQKITFHSFTAGVSLAFQGNKWILSARLVHSHFAKREQFLDNIHPTSMASSETSIEEKYNLGECNQVGPSLEVFTGCLFLVCAAVVAQLEPPSWLRVATGVHTQFMIYIYIPHLYIARCW